MTEVNHNQNGARSIVPDTYDCDFILAQAGGPNHSGWRQNNDGTKLIAYHPDNLQQVVAIIDDYEALHLEKVAKPAARKAIAALGRAKARAFAFEGMPIELDQSTEARISGAVTYLTRNTSVIELHWDLSGDGDFVKLPSATVLALGDAAGAHIQACFANRKALTDAVNAATSAAELALVDLQTGWPG